MSAVLAAAVLLAIGTLALGAPVRGRVVRASQPDGTKLQVRVWGDEYYATAESIDGYTLVRDPDTRFLCYAKLSADGNDLVSTGVVAGKGSPLRLGVAKHLRIRPEARRAKALAARARLEKRSPRIAALGQTAGLMGPYTGGVQGLCLVVDFSDDVGSIPRDNVENFCNQAGYTGYSNHGSVRDYYYDVSGGALTFTNFVPAAYYRAQHPKTWYTDPAIPQPTRAVELITEALNSLENAGFNFSTYDADGNGVVDAVSCYYAGDIQNDWAKGLWPHHSHFGTDWCADGVCVDGYQITDMSSSLTIGTFCHEVGHMLMDWPDLYDYDYDSQGVGEFCLMFDAVCQTNPIEPCAYMKYIAGWASVTELTSPRGMLTAVAGSNGVFKIPHPTLSNEYYLIENRQRTAGRDACIADEGLAIWHIDTTGSNNNQQMTPELHYLVTLVQADGQWDLEQSHNHGDSTDLWPVAFKNECTPETNPNTNWWDGSSSGVFLENISASGPSMTFTFGYATGTWVDFGYSGTEYGTFSMPYDTLFEGVNSADAGDYVWIKAGISGETLTISKAVTLLGSGGAVTIGQ